MTGADVNAKDSTQQSAYLISTSEGYLDLLELTLANGADLTSLDSYRGTGLIRAGERGHADIVGRLLQSGIDVNHVNRPGWTALDEAIVYGDGGPDYVDTVRALVAGAADLQRVAGDGRTPIQHAADTGQDDVVTTLRTAIEAAPMDPGQATAALLRAAADGDADRVAIALRDGASIESVDDRGRTPLLLASAADHLEVARLLVVLGADPDAQDDQKDSAWLVTGVTGSVEHARDPAPGTPGSCPAQQVWWCLDHSGERAGARGLCAAGGQHGDQRQSRQRSRLDRDAGGHCVWRRNPAVSGNHRHSACRRC